MTRMSCMYPFELKPLPYDYEALAPALDAQTLHFHHDKHLQTYVDNLNKVLAPYPEYQNLSLRSLLTRLESLPQPLCTGVRNNAGGVFNHQLYFDCMAPAQQSGKPSQCLQDAIQRDFGNLEQLLSQLKQAALGQFGSGWAWLVTTAEGTLSICSTPNQDVPNLCKFVPLLLVDVWEHAYYLGYQNRRADYFDAWTTLIHWSLVSNIYESRASFL